MNRRSIFKILAGAACAAAMEITGLVPSLPKAAKYVVNPEYLSAEHEDLVIFNPHAFESVVLEKYPIGNPPVKPWRGPSRSDACVKLDSPRYNLVKGQFVQVSPHTLES